MEAAESNPYLAGAYAPIRTESTRLPLAVFEGELPRDLRGAYVRNGPDPRYDAEGRYHWFDGDGMLHAVHFEDGHAHYTNRYVRTRGFVEEGHAGRALFRGIREPIVRERLPEPWKDTSNTDVKFHRGSLVTSWWLSGRPYRVDAITLETLGSDDFGGWKHRVSAHVKPDPRTSELLFFDYGPFPPFLRYGVVDAEGRLAHAIDVPTPGPRLPHDMAFTERFAILMDLSVFPDPVALAKGRFRSAFHPDVPSRFALVPRRGSGSDVRWFEVDPCYVYHVVNAWDEGDAVVLVVHRVPPRHFLAVDPGASEFDRMMHNLVMDAELTRYRFDLATGQVETTRLDDRNTEFPTIDDRVSGVRSRYSYAMDIPRSAPLAFRGIVKFDLDRGTSERYEAEAGTYLSEAPFAPREGSTAEDDGYLVSFVAREDSPAGEVHVFDAREPSRGPICRLHVPVRVPNGFHACFVDGAGLDQARRRHAERATLAAG